jgi:lantibiotic leader peptide-processing serine protease
LRFAVRFRALALALVAAAVLLLVMPVLAAARSYVVVFKSGRTTAGLKAIKAAGGTAVAVNRKVGVATARSSRTTFLRSLRSSSAVKSTAREAFFYEPQPVRAKVRAVVPAPDPATAAAGCIDFYSSADIAVPSGPEPLSPCQWDMRMINATTDGSYAVNQGAGARVGIIDTGLDLRHPDIAPNLDLAASCSFIRADTPTSVPEEQATSCADKDAVQDYAGHGTHVGSTVAAPINGIGISGVAPKATLVGLHAGTANGYFFTQPVVDALTTAGDERLDVVNMSFFADPWLYNCRNDAQQRTIIEAIRRASAYAAKRGVVQIAAAGNEFADLTHPKIDTTSPDYPPGSEVDRVVHRNCVVLPDQLPNVADVSAVGPLGQLSFYSNYGMGQITVAAPGGSSGQAPNPYGRDLAAYTTTPAFPEGSDINPPDPVFTVPNRRVDDCAHQAGDRCAVYGWIQGTSMASPHAVGVAALIRAKYPGMSAPAVISMLSRTAMSLSCPAEPDPFFTIPANIEAGFVAPECKGGGRNTSFYGAGLVDARSAASH